MNSNILQTESKQNAYNSTIQQLDWLFRHEPDLLANLANCTAIMQMHLYFFWVGFYFHRGHDLVLGPFQGPQAQPRIAVSPIPRGACGHAASLGNSVILDDVKRFPGYIASNPMTKSEIVIPLVIKGHTELVMNVENDMYDAFDEEDLLGLESIMRLIERYYFA